ncbi:hypothetical protein G7046_g6267 [Stylonectria norvegica]|nr:hypothetical protein G7046_g6267 [Stylonectria norvegica]
MSSSGSSFTSSSLGRPPTYGRTYASPVDSTWTPTSTSGISNISAPTTEGSATQASAVDLGPPGYQATMCVYFYSLTLLRASALCFCFRYYYHSLSPAFRPTLTFASILFQDTPDERTVYLGPWEVVGSEQRRVLWQGSYQHELLEHYLPSDVPSDIHPHTLHSRHRPYYDAADMERYLTFQEPHRVRYITEDGVCIHDQYIKIRYEFTTFDGSVQFQGDLRRKDLVDFYDVDVVWTNIHGRTDGFGKVKGIGAIQRLKLWRDRHTTFHSLSILANKTDGRYREYGIHCFEGELRGRDDRAKQLRLKAAAGRRPSTTADDSHHGRFSISHRMRHRVRTGETAEPSPPQQALDIRYLAIQFTDREAYRRFLETWLYCHSSDREFQGIPFPPNHFELPSPQILPGVSPGLPSPEWPHHSLDSVPEPSDATEAEATPRRTDERRSQ